MSGTATQTQFSQIPPRDSRDWEFVSSLLQDVQAESAREELASLFGQWKLSIRQFRKIEERRMVRATPDEIDLKFHKMLITDLMSFGTALQIEVAQHESQDLAKHGFNKDLLDALLKDLHNSFDEWHGQVSAERVTSLSEEILNASSETHPRDSRAEVPA
jgi:hypothetical protein